MCKAPKPPEPKEPKKPEFLRNRYLDEFIGDSSIKSLKSGRSSFRVPLGVTPVGGRQIGSSLTTSTGSDLPGDTTNPANVAPPRGDFRPTPIVGRRGPQTVR